MYTKLKFKGKLKDKFKQSFIDGNIEPDELWESCDNGKTYWTKNCGVWYRCNQIEQNDLFEEMGLAHRSDEQFFGEWDIDENNILTIDSDFKHYHNEINIFNKLLPILFDGVIEFKTLYEENDEWYVYK